MIGPNMYTGIYVKDVPATAKIFRKALGAKVRQLQPNLLELTIGKGRLLLNQRAMMELEATNPVHKLDTVEDSGKELELGIWVEDLEAVHQKIAVIANGDNSEKISFISDIENKKSGIKDFRFRLSEGYYVRVTAGVA